MPLNFKHINANEQILDGSIGTSLLADGSVTAAKLAFGAITSSNLLVDSNIDFNNFQALEFRIENLSFFPVAGNPGRLIWRTDLRDIFVDSDFTLNILSITSLSLEIGIIADATHMSVNTTTGLSVGDAIIQGGFPFGQVDILSTIDTTHLVVASTAGVLVNNVLVQANATSVVTSIIDANNMTVANTNGFQPGAATVSTPFVVAVIQSIVDSTHLVVDTTAGFVGRAIVSVDFGIVSVDDATHLTVDNSTAMSVGDVINQGLTSTTITSVVDLTHIIVASTVGLIVGIAIVFAPVDVLGIPDGTHLVVTSTAGFGPGDAINQGLASTTITSVVDLTHLQVVDSTGFALNAAKDSTITVDSTANTAIGMYLNQSPNSTVIIAVPDATHLAVADSTGFIPGPAFSGSWVSINEGANVTSIRADNNPQLHGNIQFLSGTNAHLPQLGQTITVNVPAIGSTGQLQFNNDAFNHFGADSNLFWDNVNKRLGIGTSSPTTTLDVNGATKLRSTLEVQAATTLDTTLDVTGVATLHNNLHVIGTSQQDGAVTDGSTLDVTGATTLHSTLDVTSATALHNTLAVTNLATFAGQVGIGTLTPDASASLDVVSLTRGLLTPRMTTVQRNAIASPAIGLLIYNLDSNLFNFWTGSSWLPVGSPVGNIGDVQFNAGGGLFGANPNFYWDITNARLGIGNAAPTVTLDVTGISHFSNDVTIDTKVNVNLIAGRTGDLALQPLADSTTGIKFTKANTTAVAAIDTTNSRLDMLVHPIVNASDLLLVNSVDTTKQLHFDLSGESTNVLVTLAPLLTANTTLNVRPLVDATGNILVQNAVSGQVFIGADATIGGANSGIQYSNATNANRAQLKLHSYFAGASIAGISTLTSRSGVVGTNSAVVAGQDYSKWTAQAAATTPGSAPISGTFVFKANSVNSLTVPSDYYIQLTNLAGTLGTRLYLTSEGSLAIGDLAVSGPDASAALDVTSTTRGFLPPRMTTVQKNAIVSPATGLIVYDITLNNLQEYNGTMWRNVAPLYKQDVFNVLGPGNVFTLSFTPLADSQHVFYNGLSLAPGVSEDYTISGNIVTLNAGIVLVNGDKILITYSY